MKSSKLSRPTPAAAYTVKSLIKALNILEALAEGEKPTYTLTELSRRLRLHVSTVHRLVVNLARQGFVEQDPATGGYELGFRVLRMGLRVLDRLDFRRIALPLLRELNEKTQETVHLVILQGELGISIEKLLSPQPVGLDARLGGMMPLHCTGVGKALLAFQDDDLLERISKSPGLLRHTAQTITSLPQLRKELERIRERGYSVDNEEAVDGLRCVATPIFDHAGRVVAAFSVAGPATRVTPERTPEIALLVCETGRKISYRLGYRTFRAGGPAS
jgi:IclR family acetate operon transcriptional repressor